MIRHMQNEAPAAIPGAVKSPDRAPVLWWQEKWMFGGGAGARVCGICGGGWDGGGEEWRKERKEGRELSLWPRCSL